MNKNKRLLMHIYGVERLGYDCMGYILEKGDIFTYHHIVAARHGGIETLDNGAILCGKTAHPYLHVIEKYDKRMFLSINEILLRMNQGRKIDMESLKAINEILSRFEYKFEGEENELGQPIVKPIYRVRLLTRDYIKSA